MMNPNDESSSTSFHTNESPPDPAGAVVKQLLLDEVAQRYHSEQQQIENDIRRNAGASPSLKYTSIVVLLACLASLQFGYNVGISNSTLPYIAWEFNWCPQDAVQGVNFACRRSKVYDAAFAGILFTGAMFGSLISIPLLHKGRRFAVLISFLLVFIGSITAGVCQSTYELIWARCLTGLGTGICSVCVPVYISEMSPANSRGFFGVFHQIAIVSGIAISILLGLPPVFHISLPTEANEGLNSPPYFSKLWWRLLCIFPAVLSLIAAGGLCLIHRSETPHWHVEHQQTFTATEILARIIPEDEVKAEIQRLEAETSHTPKSVYRTLFRIERVRKGLMVALFLSLSQQLTGINAFSTSCAEMLKDTGFQPRQAALFTAGIFIANVLITIPAALLIEKIGRKRLLLVGMVGQLLALGQGTIFLWVTNIELARYSALAGTIAFILFFAISLGPVVWVYIFEIFPNNIKRQAVGLAVAVNWIGSAAITALARMLQVKVQFAVFTGLGVVATCWILFCLRETKGRPLGDSPY